MKTNDRNEISILEESKKAKDILNTAAMEIRSLLIRQARKEKEELDKGVMHLYIGNIDNIDITIGANIKRVRKFRGMTQHQVAQLLNITFQQLQKYENGKNKISAARLYKLSAMLDCPFEYFFLEEKLDFLKKIPYRC
ncbi:MAG: helix-turn-helix domain-containing protein [Holosporaceae bacterium]|jgi:DNA-binding XRE family transcriptional regulator|nr:helix-turn-helix domain-containing protein [Holosporaceae bacterium]